MSDSMDESLIPPNVKRGRKSESENEENKDRLSDLPDCILLHILTFVSTKYAVQTCILSTRWKDLWKRLPTLTFWCPEYYVYLSFTKLVSKVLTLRDDSIALDELDFHRIGSIHPYLIKKIVNYAISHHVQRLGIYIHCDMQHLLPCIFTCHTLTSLKLTVYPKCGFGTSTLFPKSVNLPALTTLHLGRFIFCSSDNNRADPFSGLNRLKSLIIDHCMLKDARILCISSATLVNLTLRNLPRGIYKIELSTPCLHRFACTGFPYQYLCGSGLSSVKEVIMDTDLHIHDPEPPLILLSWLRDLVNMASLTVTTNTLQVLNLVPDLLRTKLPSLANLKKLEIRREPLSELLKEIMIDMMEREIAVTKFRRKAIRLSSELLNLRKTMNTRTAPLPRGTKDFFTQNSPSVKVKIINCLM